MSRTFQATEYFGKQLSHSEMAVRLISWSCCIYLRDCLSMPASHSGSSFPYVRVLFLWEGISWIPGWPGTFCVAKKGLDLLVLQPPPPAAGMTDMCCHAWHYDVLWFTPVGLHLNPFLFSFLFFSQNTLKTAPHIYVATQEITQRLCNDYEDLLEWIIMRVIFK